MTQILLHSVIQILSILLWVKTVRKVDKKCIGWEDIAYREFPIETKMHI